jgi:hypothetical protein
MNEEELKDNLRELSYKINDRNMASGQKPTTSQIEQNITPGHKFKRNSISRRVNTSD